MNTSRSYNLIAPSSRHIELDMSDCYTCSFEEFYPFCNALFYFSTFKAFDAGLKA